MFFTAFLKSIWTALNVCRDTTIASSCLLYEVVVVLLVPLPFWAVFLLRTGKCYSCSFSVKEWPGVWALRAAVWVTTEGSNLYSECHCFFLSVSVFHSVHEEAFLTAVYPNGSLFCARGEQNPLRKTCSQVLRSAWMLGLTASAAEHKLQFPHNWWEVIFPSIYSSC